ncbi:MAG: caspase family protein, partial [Elusimicrobia bacterium]|nr:caspase family protein [Elusimicrobiota bacterium]
MKYLAAVLLAAIPFVSGCQSALNEYIMRGDVASVDASLSSSNYRNNSGYAGQACFRNQPEVLKLLVEKGSALEETGGGASALFSCIVYDRPEMTRFLLSKGVSIADRDIKLARKFPRIQPIMQAELARRATPGAPLVASSAAPTPSQPVAPAVAPAPERRNPSSDVDAPSRRGVERPNDFALVIGIEDYQSLPKADYGARDAQTVRKHFEAMGVPARNIISLEGSQATGSKLKNYLQQWLPRNVKPESTVFVYYSGHGAPDPENGDAYLVPWDADPMFLTTSAYPLKQFYAELAKLKAKRVVVALDACFSGSGGRSVLAKGARPLVSKVDESVPSSANLTVLAAASGSEITGTLDDQAHGIFTYYFLKGLSGGAKTPRALYDYLKPHVQDDARRQNREQSPTLSGSGAD